MCVSLGRLWMNADEWSEIHRCHAEGETIKGIAERLGMSRNTVRRALASSTPPADHRRLRGSVADDVDAEVRDLLFAEPEITISEISRRLQWSSSRTILSRRVRLIRDEISAATKQADVAGVALPQQGTSFVGRRAELRSLRSLLGEHRVVTVAGPGGIGKTRLAIQAAWEFRRAFPDGVRFIGFSSVRNDDLLAQTVCDALGLDSRDVLARSAEDALIAHLRRNRMLLVFDNCEHVIDGAAALVTRIIESTSGVRIVTTSREYLSVPGEYVLALPALSTEGDSAALELFTHRAEAILSGFSLSEDNSESVRRICRRLDGVPLAIELACARLTVLSVDELAVLVEDRVLSIGGGARGIAPRHRSLQAAIAWSHELCTDVERAMWARLSVCADGFDLSVVRAVCGSVDVSVAVGRPISQDDVTDALAALVSKSVVLRETDDGRVRFRLLESIREFGASTLTAGQRQESIGRLLDWALAVLTRSGEQWYGQRQLDCAEEIRRNRGNIRAAMHFAFSEPSLRDKADEVAAALGAAPFLWACGIAIREHRRWMNRILDMPDVGPVPMGRLLAVLGLVATLQGDQDAARYALGRSAEIAEGAGDRATTVLVTHITGLRSLFGGDFDTARALLGSAARDYRTVGVPAEKLSMVRIHQGMLYASTLDVDAARSAFREVYDSSELSGETWFRSYAAYGLGLVAWLDGDHKTAVRWATEALRTHRVFDDVVGTTLMTDLLGWSSAAAGSGEDAAVLMGAASTMWGSFGQQLYGSAHWNALRGSALDKVRAQMTDQAFAVAWDRGAVMSSTELFAYALPDVEVTSGVAAPIDKRPMLSPRESEVAELVAVGLSNREIADRLVLSVRTVEGHVEHVLRKMGVDRRSQVAALMSV